MSRLPDPITVRCQRRGRYRLARFLAIARTDNPPHARLTFAAVMGYRLAADQSTGHRRLGMEVCGIIYELPSVSVTATPARLGLVSGAPLKSRER